MKSTRNTTWNLQGIIDLEKNIITSSITSREYSMIEYGALRMFSLPSSDLNIPNEVNSYESETGISLDSILSLIHI